MSLVGRPLYQSDAEMQKSRDRWLHIDIPHTHFMWNTEGKYVYRIRVKFKKEKSVENHDL